jgi:DNA-directed RNA polymerase specialized sigma24 family protein
VLGLPPDLRDTVTAHYWAEIPVREIAREAGITPVAVRKRLKKALTLLGAALEEART